MSKKPPDMSKVTKLYKTTFADILNKFGQGKIEPHSQILDGLTRAEGTTQDGMLLTYPSVFLKQMQWTQSKLDSVSVY